MPRAGVEGALVSRFFMKGGIPMTHLVLMCFGVCVCLCGAVWIISLVKAALKRRAHRAFLSVMKGRNDTEKASAQQCSLRFRLVWM
jgi:hypothetical protein